MRKLLLSVLLCAALVMGLLPTAAFPMELGNTPEAVEKAPTSALEEQTVNEELLSEYGEQKNAPKAADPAAQNDAAEIYVSSTGNDEQNTGTKDLPFATLAKAVDAAADGTTIYVMSDLTMDQCARFYDKSLKITSGEGGPYTITRSADFKQQSDTARSWYNPAMIEVQSSSASSVGLTLSDIVLDDAGMHEGTVFAQAVSGDGNGDNTVYVQDAIIASNATVPCTVTLGKDAVLRNFGGARHRPGKNRHGKRQCDRGYPDWLYENKRLWGRLSRSGRCDLASGRYTRDGGRLEDPEYGRSWSLCRRREG